MFQLNNNSIETENKKTFKVVKPYAFHSMNS